MRILRSLNKGIHALSAATLLALTVVVLTQITFRYVLRQPLTEAEEIARFSMIWLAMLASTVVVRMKGHIRVGYLVQKLSARLQKWLRIVVHVIEIVFFAILLIVGYNLAMGAMAQTGAATGIRMGWIMASIPISAAVSLLYVTEHLVEAVAEPPKPETEPVTQEPIP